MDAFAPRPFGFGDYIKPSNLSAGDGFGVTVAVSKDGTRMAVGSPFEDSSAQTIDGVDDELAQTSGAVYIFRRSNDAWVQEAYLKSSNSDAGDSFGVALAMSDDGATVAVGAHGERSNGSSPLDNSLSNAGAAYVFTRSGMTWSQQAYLKSSNPGGNDQFARHLALSGDGNTVAVGASNEDSAGTGINGTKDEAALDSGAVYLYRRVGVSWSESAFVKAPVVDPGDQFGAAVALSDDGQTLAVGAKNDDSNASTIGGDATNNSAMNAGAVHIFVYDFVLTGDNSPWSFQAYIKPSNPAAQYVFGTSVALSGDGATLAVGAPNDASGSASTPGDNSLPLSGAVHVFKRSGSQWAQQAYLKASNPGMGDGFGTVSLSNDGSILAVEAAKEDSNAVGLDGNQLDDSIMDSGAVYLFKRTASIWTQTAYVKAPNPDVDDTFGSGATNNDGGGVQISGDGAVLVVGANREDSGSKTIQGDMTDNTTTNAGAAYVYR